MRKSGGLVTFFRTLVDPETTLKEAWGSAKSPEGSGVPGVLKVLLVLLIVVVIAVVFTMFPEFFDEGG